MTTLTAQLIRAAGALGLAVAVAACDARARDDLMYLERGWSAEVRTKFYHYPQGSRFIPRPWFVALERLDGEGRFADPDNLVRYGLLCFVADYAAIGVTAKSTTYADQRDQRLTPISVQKNIAEKLQNRLEKIPFRAQISAAQKSINNRLFTAHTVRSRPPECQIP